MFRNYNRLDCRRANLMVVTKEEARQHRRVRKDSITRAKGVHFNRPEGTFNACFIRGRQLTDLGTHDSRADAVETYAEAMMRENPDLHSPPVFEEELDWPNGEE